MINGIFLFLASAIAQLNTNVPVRTFRTVPTSTINFITNIITRPPRSTTTTTSTSFLTTTFSTQPLTTEPSDNEDQSIGDAIIVGTIWGIIALIILYVCCKKKKEIQPIEPPSLEYVKEKSYSSHVYAEIDEHPYEMPTIMEEPYGQQVTAL